MTSCCSANGPAWASSTRRLPTVSPSLARLKPGGDIGRVWSMSRALTYRALDQLVVRGHVEAVGEERGLAGGNRTLLAVTTSGRAQFRTWLATPTAHLRDMRSELLLKIVLADGCGVELGPMFAASARACLGHRDCARGRRRGR